MTGVPKAKVRAVGLDTPGPASADGVLATGGATNFGHPDWSRFNIRAALEERLGIPVLYNNDGNAAALYAHHVRHGAQAPSRAARSPRSSAPGSAAAWSRTGASSRARSGWPASSATCRSPWPACSSPTSRCRPATAGRYGDAESIASLTGITRNLLPYWLTRFPGHELAGVDIAKAAKLVRGYAERGDEMALEIFRQQAMAIGPGFLHRGQVHRPGHLLRRRRGDRGGAALPRLVRGHGQGEHDVLRRAGGDRGDHAWSPTWTWQAPAAPPSRRPTWVRSR